MAVPHGVGSTQSASKNRRFGGEGGGCPEPGLLRELAQPPPPASRPLALPPRRAIVGNISATSPAPSACSGGSPPRVGRPSAGSVGSYSTDGLTPAGGGLIEAH
uniref:Uncharacterized protein n=1 Tax=Oryza nivara TaxID=4536 RepID=A0A0E0GKI8_ORYNI